MTDGTVTLLVANGKTIMLSNAWAAGEWSVATEEGLISARFEGKFAQEITG